MTQAQIADALGVSCQTISQIIHEHRPITPDMAIRLARLLGGIWVNMQQALDIWLLEQKYSKDYENIEAVDRAA